MAATHKTTLFILAYALLEWILIIMLLLNSFFSYLIRKFAAHYRLKPPCFWCSTIDHLLEPNNNINPYPDLICKAHATEILNLYCSSDAVIKVTSEPLCRNGRCSCCFQVNYSVVDGSSDSSSSALRFKSVYGKNEVVQVMDVPDVENKSSGHIQVFDQIIPLEWTDSSTSCSTTSSAVSNGHQSMVFEEQDQVQKQDGRFLKLSDCQDEEDKSGLSIDSLMAELKAERLAVCGLYIELDAERTASAIAAKHAMATITRLEQEKVALRTESMRNQRMMDEQAEYDQEVVQLLNELVMKLEKEKVELENEVEMYKEKLLDSCSKEECLDDDDESGDVLDLKKLRRVEESAVWIKDVIRKASLDGEDDVSYKGINNRVLFHDLFDHVEVGMNMNMNEEDDEASHSAWRQTSF